MTNERKPESSTAVAARSGAFRRSAIVDAVTPMSEYERIVEKCRRDRINRRISNTSIEHAAVLFKHLFIAAASIPESEPQEMRIQTGDAHPAFYESYVDCAQRVMGRGVNIRVILTDSKADIAGNAFLSTVLRHSNGDVRTSGSQEEPGIHFAVVGSSAYRIEVDLDTFEAFANFNESIIAHRLIGIFDQEWVASARFKQEEPRLVTI
ncbi:MAG TPA: hypothetical protein VHW60_13535 [Caulobacteraceae bacterium]|nr:hypothetical protein [Caulobacteraceae bacterium]